MRRLVLLLPLFGLLACREPTQISVEVTTDVPCTDYRGTTIAVSSLDQLSNRPEATTSSKCTGGVVGQAVIVPTSADDGEVAFEVRTGIGVDPKECVNPASRANCIVARRALRFIPHTKLLVKVAMTGDCRGVVCEAQRTCLHGTCVDATIDPTRCEGGCGDEVLGKPTGDAGVSDSGFDASTPGNVLELSLGRYHSCAVMKDRTVRCWGANASGQLGIGGDAGAAGLPTLVSGLADVRHVGAFSEGNTCALLGDGTVRCWGSACCGQLGTGAVVDQRAPVVVSGVSGATQLGVGRNHTCAVSPNGVSCWGFVFGSSGVPTPITVSGASGGIRSIGGGDNFTILGMNDGTLRVAGANRFYQLGTGVADEDAGTTAFVAVPNLTGVTEVANGNSFVHARLADGGAMVWGESGAYQLGLNGTNPVASPTASPALSGLHGVSLGDQFGCALDATNAVVCWGQNDRGQLGPNATGAVSVTPIKIGLSASAVAVGWAHACAIDLAGAVFCWGYDEFGQLGDGGNADRKAPFKLAL